MGRHHFQIAPGNAVCKPILFGSFLGIGEKSIELLKCYVTLMLVMLLVHVIGSFDRWKH